MANDEVAHSSLASEQSENSLPFTPSQRPSGHFSPLTLNDCDMPMSLAPVVLFTYNRPEHTRVTVEALKANSGACETDLHIYSDGPKNASQAESVMQVRSYLRTVEGFKSVALIEREQNMGLAASVIAGVTELLANNPAVIVVEDDLFTTPGFLTFMNAALKTYASRADIFSVTGYNYPLPIPADYPEDAYLSYRSSSWGWGTWPDRWCKVDWQVSDFDEFVKDPAARQRFARGGDDLLPMLRKQLNGELDSWSIRFDYAHCKYDALCLHPVRSRLRNIGFDGSGIHCGVSNEYDAELDEGRRGFILRPDIEIDPLILRIFDQRFRSSSIASSPLSLLKRVVRRVARSIRAI
jgi:hypothetical protein